MMDKPFIGCAALLLATTVSAAPYRIETGVVLPNDVRAYGIIDSGSFTSGPAGYEALSWTEGEGSLMTASGFTSSQIRMAGSKGLYVPAGHKEIKLHSDQSEFSDGTIAGTLRGVQPVNSSPVTLYYVAEWETLAYPGGVVPEDPWWNDLANRGQVQLSIKVSYANFLPDERAFSFDLFETPCRYTNRVCATNDIIHLKELPEKVEYVFSLDLGGQGIGIGLPGYDYTGRLAIGFGQTLPCPPGTFIGRCQVAIPFEDWNGPGQLWPPVQRVPEPSTWAMFLAGFMIVGRAVRRSRGLADARRI